MPFIALKNLQNLHICHVGMQLANLAGAVLYSRGVFQSAIATGTVVAAGVFA